MIHFSDIKKNINIDEELERGGYIGFCIHTCRDVLLYGLNEMNAAKITFEKIADVGNAIIVINDAETMIPIIAARAKKVELLV